MLAGAVALGIETYGLLFGADFVLDFSESQRIDVEFRIDAAFWISPLPGNLMASMTGCFWPEDGFRRPLPTQSGTPLKVEAVI